MDRYDAREISLFGLVNGVLRHRAAVIAFAVLGAAVVVLITIMKPRRYTTSSTFMAQTRRQAPTVSGLAAQLGLSVPTTDGMQSPDFYVDLLHSPQILQAASKSTYEIAAGGARKRGTLVSFYEIGGASDAERLDAAARQLATDLRTSVAPRTGVVRLAVTADTPDLAVQISRRLVDLINEFNQLTRKSQASAERQFTEERVSQVRAELRAAEEDLASFQSRNRNIDNSASLRLEYERLHRAVAMEQTLYTSIAQAYEQAKIEEVRDTPLITVIDPPQSPLQPDSRHTLLRGILGLIFGGLLGLMLGISRDFAHTEPATREDDRGEFARLLRDTAEDFRHPARALRRSVGRA